MSRRAVSDAEWEQRRLARYLAHRDVPTEGKSCESCGASGVQLDRHHDDYAKPLDVRLLCRPCHAARHRTTTVEERNARLADAYEAMRNGLITRKELYAIADREGVGNCCLNGIWRRARGLVGQGKYWPKKSEKARWAREAS